MLINLAPNVVVPVGSTSEWATPWFSMDGANGFHAQVICFMFTGSSTPIIEVLVEISGDQVNKKAFNSMFFWNGSATQVLMSFTALGGQQETVAAGAPAAVTTMLNQAAVGAPWARLVFKIRGGSSVSGSFAVSVNTIST